MSAANVHRSWCFCNAPVLSIGDWYAARALFRLLPDVCQLGIDLIHIIFLSEELFEIRQLEVAR